MKRVPLSNIMQGAVRDYVTELQDSNAELLEALEAVWNEATWANDPHDNYLVPKEQIRKARAAIAAAKGES